MNDIGISQVSKYLFKMRGFLSSSSCASTSLYVSCQNERLILFYIRILGICLNTWHICDGKCFLLVYIYTNYSLWYIHMLPLGMYVYNLTQPIYVEGIYKEKQADR